MASKQPQTAFAVWLDSMIPAVFPNDAAFARRVGTDPGSVHYWRKGRRPQPTALVRIADATGTSIDTLMRIVGYVADPGAVRHPETERGAGQ